jgi:glyoxylase-like metal-dependent hydrolase (beta-lactamase superfamily II)
MSAPAISARDLHERIRNGDRDDDASCGTGVSVLDVRDRDEFEAWHVDGPGVTARHVPYMEFVAAGVTGDAPELLPADLREPVVVVCGVGEASAEVAEDLRRADVDAVNLAGGMATWGDLVVAHDLRGDDGRPDGSGDGVVQFERPSSGCLSYLLADGDEAAVVDPLAAAVDEYVAAADDRGVSIEYAVDTHVHADHVSGVRRLADANGAERVLPEGAADRGLDYDATLVGDGDELPVGDREVEVEHAPGHTTEQVVLAWGADLLTGDCLFLDSVGRPDLEDEDAARELAGRQYDSLQRLFERADGDDDDDEDTRVLPGHVEPSTARDGPDGGFARSLGAVRDGLSLRSLDREAFVDRVTTDLPPRPANYEAIVRVNLGREPVDEESLDLERGPNNCAVSSVD